MSIKKVLEMAERFVTIAEETVLQSPANIEYKAQRDKLSQFYDMFYRQLRAIISEMGSDLGTLKMRGFDTAMWQMFGKVYHNLIDISKQINEDKPYIAGEKFVHYVLGKEGAMTLDNLNFLIKHHLQKTNVDFVPSKSFKHPEARSLELAKKLAMHVKKFMEENPLIESPSISKPPSGLPETLKDVPAFFAGKEDLTNPGGPNAKKKSDF